MTNEQWDAWLLRRPPAIADAARRYPGWKDGRQCCYRSHQNARYHYTLYSYSEDRHGRVTCTLVHGADSTLPGVGTFGQPLEQLVPCDCGQWAPASDEQREQTRKRLETMRFVTEEPS